MTKQILFRIGLYSRKTKHIIPRHMGHTLPRPCRIGGRMAAEFWYFSVESSDLKAKDYIKMYAAVDIITGEILRLCTFKVPSRNDESFETGYLFWRISHGKRYLRQCAKLLSQDLVSDEQIYQLQQRWLELQPSWVKNHVSVNCLTSDRLQPVNVKAPRRTGDKYYV